MSYYKDQPPPPKQTVGERLDEMAPRFFEPTYERKDLKSRWPEAVMLIGAAIVAVWLIVVFAGWAHASYPTNVPTPYITQPLTQEEQNERDGCYDPDVNIICPGDPFESPDPGTTPTSSGD